MKVSGNKHFTNFIKDNYKLLLLFCFLSLLNIFFLCWSFSSNNLSFNGFFIVILMITIVLEITLCTILFISKKKKWTIEKLFIILGLIVGFFYVVALPVGRAPDEVSHFTRIYELSKGHLVSDVNENGKPGTVEPSNIMLVQDYRENNVTYSKIQNDLSVYPDESNQDFVRTSAYNYNIISYLPHTIGMFTGNAIHLPLLITAYLAKLCNLFSCLLILYFSIKYIPILKKFVFFLTFLPITMQAMSSLSPDGLVISSAVALMSFVLYSTYTLRSTFSKKHYILAFIICLFLSMGKIVYAPLCLLLFTIPKERFGSAKKKLFSIIAIGASIFLLLILWLLVAPSLQSSYDPSIQVATIASNPFRYLATVFQSMSVNAHLYITGFLGGYLEWFDVVLSPFYIIPNFIIFTILCYKAKQDYYISRSIKVFSAIIFTLITVATFTTMYIQWTKTGETIIDGVQGRYFLPLLLLIPILFISSTKNQNKVTKKIKNISQDYYLYGFYIFESVYAISTIVCSHL